MPYRIDLHCHSVASPDGSLNEVAIGRMLRRGRLDVVAITDHDRIDEALRLQTVFGPAIIVGEEITTADGEIIGLFLTEPVKPNMSAVDTVKAIKKQKGLVYIPHPFEKLRKGVTPEILKKIIKGVDIIETINGRSFSAKARVGAVRWSQEYNIVGAASSDAHGTYGWGRVYTEVDEHPTRETLVKLLGDSHLHGLSNGYVSYLYPKLNRIRNRARRQVQ